MGRRLFLVFRTFFLLLLLAVVILGFFFNKVGLPEPIKKRVVAQLRLKGWDVQFSRLRLRWHRGLVAESLQLQRTNQLFGPRLFVEEAQCRLLYSGLKHFKFEASSMEIKGGRLIWPLAVTNQHQETFRLDDVEGELIFGTQDRWELRALRARCLGATLDLSGSLTHASAIRDWKFPRRVAPASASTELWLHRLEAFAKKLQFTRPPQVTGTLHGDALDFTSFQADLKLAVEALESPWGAATNIVLAGQLIPALHSDEAVRAEIQLAAHAAHSPWGETEKLQLRAQLDGLFTQPGPTNFQVTIQFDAPQTGWAKMKRLRLIAGLSPTKTNAALSQTELKVFGEELHSEWGQASQVQLTVRATHSATNLKSSSVSGELRFDELQTRWGNAPQAQIHFAGIVPSTNQLKRTALAWPDRFENIPFEATATVRNLHSSNFEAENVSLATQWQSPQLRLQLSGELGEGGLSGKAELNSTSRELAFDASSTFDPNMITSLFPTNAQRWLGKYSWKSPPLLEAQGRLTLPPWTNREPNWRGEVMPTLFVAGKFQVGAGAYRNVNFDSASSPFILSNLLWRIPELKVSRPEGTLEGAYTSDKRTRDFHWRLRSQIDPKAVKSLLEEETQQRAFDYFEFTVPPVIEAEIWANWLDMDRLGIVARIAATNFTVRGETVKDCVSRLHYTNKFLAFLEPQVQREGERGAAPGIGIDLERQKLYLTNAFGNLDPQAVARVISRKTGRIMEPYRFASPPTTRAHGVVDLTRRRMEYDLHFEIAGGPFQWKFFHLDQIAGNVGWVGEILTLTNVTGAAYGGRIAGSARFDFAPTNSADFSFKLAVAEAKLASLVADLGNKTNKLEGMISGELVVTQANTSDFKSWQGHGRTSLRDGLLWDIPLFGVFSPILNLFIPGLGNSRARQGTATFTIINSVIHTKDLEIRATAMRMNYDGIFDFERRVEGRMEAELLRDLPAIGFFISKVFWPVTKLFEYRVTGTLGQPKTEPLYTIPKLLLMPFHPIRTLKEMLPPEEKVSPEKKSPPP